MREPAVVPKPRSFQNAPKVPNFDDEAKKAVEYEGLPDLTPNKTLERNSAIFRNVKSLHTIKDGSVQEMFSVQEDMEYGTVVVQNGSIICHGTGETCAQMADSGARATVIDLDGGAISPGLVSFGCWLGLEEIFLEPSTTDGPVFDPLQQTAPSIVGGKTSIVRAADGLQFGTRHALEAYRAGVSSYIPHFHNLNLFALNPISGNPWSDSTVQRRRGVLPGSGSSFQSGSPE